MHTEILWLFNSVMAKEKILVGMSGGVDSSVAAFLLKEAGYDVSAAYIKVWMNETDVFGRCPAQQDIDDGSAVAELLGIDYQVINLIEDYRSHVVDYLVEGYRKGVTPNPDMLCNREVKFGVFLRWAMERGFDGVGTGHYCRRIINEPDKAFIHEGLDRNKDQSYFLALLRKQQIQKARFPLGELTKPEVRALAKKLGLPNADKRDSQGICFLGEVKINEFLGQFIEDNPGPIINHEDRIVGEHLGLHRYTIGQRKGIGVPSNTDNKAYVVVDKDYPTNSLHVAFDQPNADGLWQESMDVVHIHYADETLEHTVEIQAKPRYRDPSQAVTVTPTGTDSATIRFHQPQRALASGQVVAFYDGSRLIGGGFYA